LLIYLFCHFFDQDGQVTVTELANAVERTGAEVNHEQLSALLKAADIDGDGTLSYNELVLTTVQRRLSAKEERLW
jgi:Ca2+-binding EF-hand superfamily protein